MTSLNVPEKFYQVCRLCLTVVSDTKALHELSLFGEQHHLMQLASIGVDVKPNIKDIDKQQTVETKGTKSIGSKTNVPTRRSSNRRSIGSADTDEQHSNNTDDNTNLNCHQIKEEVCNNNNIDDLEHQPDYADDNIVHEKEQQRSGAYECDRYNSDESQVEILEQIDTFLAISVSHILTI